MGETIVITAINLDQRIALLEDGSTIPLETLLDDEGDETDDIADAVVAVAPLPNGKWVTIAFSAFKKEGGALN